MKENKTVNLRNRTWALLPAFLVLAPANGQGKPDVAQFVAELRKSIAQNQTALRQYAWTETREISLKGELKKREQSECSYSPDGKLQKTPVGTPELKKAAKGLKGKMVANKVEEMKEYMDRVGSLVRRYVPPDPQAMKSAFEAGKASLAKPAAGEFATLQFQDYAKPGDAVTITLDAQSKRIRSFRVKTYLDAPADGVEVDAAFSSLDGGVNYVEQTVLKAAAKEIEIKTVNFGHRRNVQ
jgi:hypothetical protein